MSRLALRTPMAILPLDDAETIMYPMLGVAVIYGGVRVFSYNDKLFALTEVTYTISPTCTSKLPDGIDGLLSMMGSYMFMTMLPPSQVP